MAKKYELRLKYKETERLLTVINGDRVNLSGKDYIQTTKETKDSPSQEVKFKGATQKHLKAYFEFPNQKLVVVTETKKEEVVIEEKDK